MSAFEKHIFRSILHTDIGLGAMAHVEKHLPSKHKALHSNEKKKKKERKIKFLD
jgi:hypothetical protein